VVSAKIYSLAWSTFLLGATALALNKMGLLPYGPLAEYSWSVGAMIMALLLSVALAYSIEKLRRQQRASQRLVDQRTAELAEQTEAAQSAQAHAEEAHRESDVLRKRAVRCALGMQKAMVALHEAWAADRLPKFMLRIGVHHGPVVVGIFGSDKRSEYTAIGPTVNLAARIESACAPGQCFVSGEVCDLLPEGYAELAGEFELKGVDGTRNLFRLLPQAAGSD
jgi:hypothetical protein